MIKSKVNKFKTYPKRLLDAFPDLTKYNAKEFAIMKKLRYKSKKKKHKK